MSLRFPTLRRFETLRAFGVAAEHFPAYTNTRLRPHSLDVVLGTFVIGGAGRHIMGDEIHRDGPGSFGITHYGQEHDILAERPMEIINLYLDPQNHALPPLAPELAPALQSFLPIHPGFHHRCNRRVRLRFADPGPPAALLRQLADETRTAQAGRRQAMEASLQVFLTLCCREVLQSGLEMGGGTEEGGALERVRRHLDATAGEPQRLDRLAAMARLTPEGLCRAFKRYTGKSVFDYLHQRRIESAAFALRHTDEKILAVALECGFRDVSFFNRKFRALMGCAPTAYRARWRGRMRALTQDPAG